LAVRYGTTNQNTLKMAKKKKYIYRIYVESYGEYEVYAVKANTFAEAKNIAKKKFIKEYWKPSSLKCSIEDKSLNY